MKTLIWRTLHNFKVRFQHPPYTPGFRSIKSMAGHFMKHGAEFGSADIPAYVEAADRFCGGKILKETLICFRRRDGARVMYNENTGEFAFVHTNGCIGSYMRMVTVSKGRRFFANKCAE